MTRITTSSGEQEFPHFHRAYHSAHTIDLVHRGLIYGIETMYLHKLHGYDTMCVHIGMV